MAAAPSIDLSGWLSEQLSQASPDLLREMLTTFVEALMGAEADAVCGAPFGAQSDERVNARNGYRRRDWDTRAGTIEVAMVLVAPLVAMSAAPAAEQARSRTEAAMGPALSRGNPPGNGNPRVAGFIMSPQVVVRGAAHRL